MKLLFSLILCSWISSIHAQQWIGAPLNITIDSTSRVSFDNLSSLYVINANSTLLMENPQKNQLYSYQNSRLGSLGSIDVTDPFKILLFYPLFQTIVTLDNTLNQSAKLDFHTGSIGTIRAICRSADNNLWIYDESNRLIDKIDPGGKILIQGIPNYGLTLQPGIPAHLYQDGNLVFLTQSGNPIFVFDQFGKNFNKILLPPDADILQIKGYIYYISDSKLRRYDYTKPSMLADVVILDDIKPNEKFALDFSRNRIYKIDSSGKFSYISQ